MAKCKCCCHGCGGQLLQPSALLFIPGQVRQNVERYDLCLACHTIFSNVADVHKIRTHSPASAGFCEYYDPPSAEGISIKWYIHVSRVRTILKNDLLHTAKNGKTAE